MKTLILGRGYLGSLIAARYNTMPYGTQDVDITRLASLEAFIEQERPDRIINTAAYTNTNEAEKPENRAWAFAVNVQGPANIAYLARKRSIPWVHFSTGMMFDGTKPDGGGWQETDVPQPTGYYAWTKAWADGELSAFAEQDRILILRIHTPLANTEHPRNFLNRLQRFNKAIDIASSVTVVEDLLPAMDALIEKQAHGTYNAVNPGTVSAFRIAQIMQEEGLIAAEKELTPLTREELDAMSGAHQTFPVLDTQKITAAAGPWRDAETAVRETAKKLLGS